MALDPDELPSVDLRTLLGEMAALKAEVRAQTSTVREVQAEAVKGTDALRQELERAASREAAQRQAVDDERRRSAMALIDLSDRIEAALASVAVPVPRRFFVRADPRLGAFAEGLRLTLRRASEHLGGLGVRRVEVVDRDFDPKVMEAVGTQQRADRPNAVVLSEITAGYADARGALRTAQVIVNALETQGKRA